MRAQQGQNQSYKGGLTCSRLAQDGRTATRVEIKRQVVNHLPVGRFILIRNRFQLHATRSFQLYGLSLLLHGVLLQFHQTLCGREHAHEGRHQLGQSTCRTLNPVHQLQEGGHTTEGKRTGRHAQGRPQESNQVAQGEAEVQDQVTEHREHRAFHHVLPQLTLRVLQSVNHHRITLQRLDEHSVLHRLL